MVQEQMAAVITGFWIVFLILVCASVTTSSYGRERSEVWLFDQVVDPNDGVINEDLVEHLRINCRLDIVHVKESVQALDWCFLYEALVGTDEINYSSRSLDKEEKKEPIVVVRDQLKQMFLDRLRKCNFLIHVSGEEIGSMNWYNKYLGSLFHRRNKYLGSLFHRNRRGLFQNSGDTPTPAPALAPGSPPPSSQVPDSVRPAPAPHKSFFPPIFSDSSSRPPSGSVSSASPVKEDKKTSRNKIVIAVTVTASVVIIIAALVILGCTRGCWPGSRARKNDERPLLSLSLSDYSIGSSHNPFALQNSTKEEKLGHQISSKNSNNSKIMSSPYDNFVSNSVAVGDLGASNNTDAQVPPPGKMGIASVGLPPLRPPAGRVDPLPPQSASSFMSLPSKSAPSPPPRPASSPLKPSGKAGSPSGPPLPPAPPAYLESSGTSCLPPGQPPPFGKKPGPPPPPPPRSGAPPPPPRSGAPPPPPRSGAPPPRPPEQMAVNSRIADSSHVGVEANTSKAKLKPFFWDKVLANPDTSMVWHQIKAGSFQFDEEMIESLFGSAPIDKNKNERRKESSSQDPITPYIQILDSKKAQNISILLRALNVKTEEVRDAINEGYVLPSEILETLLKMAPTQEEEMKLRLFKGEFSQLGPAEQFLKALVDIPFAFKRFEAMLFMSTLQEEVIVTKESFATLEVACKELRSSRLFLKLLEAVLKTGNRMNDGTFRGGAQAFKLDTLLKLSDVKGTDGKTTLLHFVVQEIIRSEGVRAARASRESMGSSVVTSDDLLEDISSHSSEEHYRNLGLQVVSGLGNELENVKKAANLDSDSLTGTVSKLGRQLVKTQHFLDSDMKSVEEKHGFYESLKSFVQHSEHDVKLLLEEEKRIMTLVKSTGDYFHGHAAKNEGLHLFVIVRDFLIILDKVCKEVGASPQKHTIAQRKEAVAPTSTSDPGQPPDLRERLFPAITDQRINYSSSDDEG